MSHKCEHEKDSDICVECWEEKNLEPRMTMTTPSTELDKAIERLENELAISGSDVDQFSTDIQTACNAVKRCQQLELDVKLGIESKQEICKERDDLQGGRIDLARQSLALKEQLSQLRDSQQALVKERDELQKAYLTVKGWAHRLEYKLIAIMEKCEEAALEEPAGSFPDNLVCMMNELDLNKCDTAQLRAEYKKALKALKEISTWSRALLHSMDSEKPFPSVEKVSYMITQPETVLSTPLASETMKDKII